MHSEYIKALFSLLHLMGKIWSVIQQPCFKKNIETKTWIYGYIAVVRWMQLLYTGGNLQGDIDGILTGCLAYVLLCEPKTIHTVAVHFS